MVFKTKLGEPIVVAQVQISLSQREMDKLQRQARRADNSLSDYVRDVVRRQLR